MSLGKTANEAATNFMPETAAEKPDEESSDEEEASDDDDDFIHLETRAIYTLLSCVADCFLDTRSATQTLNCHRFVGRISLLFLLVTSHGGYYSKSGIINKIYRTS
jgi:hypothetical protein